MPRKSIYSRRSTNIHVPKLFHFPMKVQCRLGFKPRVLFKSAFHTVCASLYITKLAERSKAQIHQSQKLEKSRVQTQDEISKLFLHTLSFQEIPNLLSANVSTTTMIIKRILSTPHEQRSFSDENLLKKYLKRMQCFQRYPVDVQEKLLRVIRCESYEPGRVIIKEGHHSSAVYFLWQGSVIVNKKVKDHRKLGAMFNLTVKVLEGGRCFGMREVLQGIKRENTIISRTWIELLSVDKKNFHKILGVDLIHKAEEASCYVLSLQPIKIFPMLPFILTPQSLFTNYYGYNSVVATFSEFHSSNVVVVVRHGRCKIVIHYAPPTSSCHGNPHTSPPSINSPPSNYLPRLPNDSRNIVKTVKAHSSTKRKRFYQIGIVEEGECFGLQLLFNKALCSISLVSIGSECISIGKEFFIQDAPPHVKKSLALPSGYYPDKHVLDDALRQQMKWVTYKQSLVEQITLKNY